MIQLLWILFELSVNIFEMYLFYIVLKHVKDYTKIELWDIFNIVLFSAILVLLNHIFEIGSIYVIIIMFILWFIWGIYYDNNKQIIMIIFRILLVFLILLVSDIFCSFLSQIVLKSSFQIVMYKNIYRIFFIFISKCLSYVIIKHIAIPKYEFILGKGAYFYGIIALFIIDIAISVILIQSIFNLQSSIQESSTNILFNTLIAFVLNISVMSIGFLVVIFINKQMHSRNIEKCYEQQKVIIKQFEHNITNINKSQHEYGNNLSTISVLLMNNEIDKAKSFLYQVLHVNNQTIALIKKSNSFIEIIVKYKLDEANTNNIKTYSSLSIPNDIPINQYDIAIILNNALDNAIEACSKVSPVLRYIKCSVYLKLGYLNLYFENSSLGDYKTINGKLVTSKIDKKNHGLGIQNIEYIVNKYDGIINYKLENNKYILRCSLLITNTLSS